MDYQALKTEIETGPLAAEFAGKSDLEIEAILNEPRYQAVRTRFITARTILAEIPNGAGILEKLQAAAAVSPPVKWAMVFLGQEGGLDIGHPNTQGQIDALVGATVLTAEEGAALKGMALQAVSRAGLAGFEAVTYGEVSRALRGPW